MGSYSGLALCAGIVCSLFLGAEYWQALIAGSIFAIYIEYMDRGRWEK